MAEHATKAYIGHGTLFQRGNGDNPETFSIVSEVIAVEPPDEQADDIEVSHFESPSKTKEYIRGMIETGEVSFSINWNPVDYANHATIRADKADGLVRNYRIVLPGARETITFPGYVKGLKRNVGSPSEPVTADVTIKVSGAVTAV